MKSIRIDHLTEYRFFEPVTLLEHRMLLRPREGHSVRVASSELSIEPAATLRWQRDPLDNSVALAAFRDRGTFLRIASRVVIEHFEETPFDFIVEAAAVTYPFSYAPKDALLLGPFMQPSWPTDAPVLDRWLAGLGFSGQSIETFVLLVQLNRSIHDRFRYQAREQPGVQSPATTLGRGSGSCRDFAALFIESCRRLGLASRFVSGYLSCPTDTAVVAAGATHAWAEVYLPGPGWKGFDPTCSTLTSTDHVAVAVAQHPEDVPPVAGSFLGSLQARPDLKVSVRVEPTPSA